MIQIGEFFSTEEQCYLLIHKSACSTIRRQLLQEFRDKLLMEQESGGVRWTVVRDPYERFIDAVSYDIGHQEVAVDWDDLDQLEKIVMAIPMAEYLVQNIRHNTSKKGGVLPHSMLQSIYMFDANIEYVVYAKNLDQFISMHFSNPVEPQNLGNSKHQEVLSLVMDRLPSLKKEVLNLLRIDYIMLEQFSAQGKVWSWGCGKIW